MLILIAWMIFGIYLLIDTRKIKITRENDLKILITSLDFLFMICSRLVQFIYMI